MNLPLTVLVAHALGAPLPVRVEATVSEDGRSIAGVLHAPPGTELRSPLPLPEPSNDLQALRTYPGRPDPGSMTWVELEPGWWAFETRLPRRFGGLGATSRGTFALGGFHPVPMVGGHLPTVAWDVEVTLPEGRIGVLGDTVGDGVLTWSGVSDRVVLALPRAAHVQRLVDDGLSVTLVGRGRPPRRWTRHLSEVLPSIAHREPWEVVLVEAPLRRRLIRPAQGTAFLSDRAFRLFSWFQPYHRHGVVRGVAAAASGLPGPLERELVGTATAERWRQARGGDGAAGLTRTFAWVPTVDLLLASRRMAFYSETLEEVLPSDPVRDDLFDVLDPYRSAPEVAAQLDDRYGSGTAAGVAAGLAVGLTLPQALQRVGVDPSLAASWRAPPVRQDYRLEIGEPTTVTRTTTGPAAPETVIVRVDGVPHPVTLAPGESASFGQPARIVVDPGRHVPQTSRMGDAWPVRQFRVTLAGGISSINLSRFRPVASGAMWIRGRHDTRNVFAGALSTTRSKWVDASVGWTRRIGPLIDGIARRQRVSTFVGASLVDPTFFSLADGRVTVDGSVAWTWDTRVSSEFPLRGHRLSVSVGGGAFPGSPSRWGDVGVTGVALGSWHPRHVLAVRGTLGIARSTRPDQLLGLAGLGAMRSLPVLPPCPRDDRPCAPVATERATGAFEYRVAPLRGMSVPVGFGWWTELQLTAGLEGLVARTVDGPARAVGATAGIAGVGDVFGAEPNQLGFTAGWLLWEDGLSYAPALRPVPEVYLRWSQAF